MNLDWRTRLTINAGWWVLRVLGWTWRSRVAGRDALVRRAPGTDAVVYTLWHGQMLPVLWSHHVRTGVLVSEHRDGEIITRILEKFGMFGVRGSSSRGGTRALLEAVQVVREGTDMAFTPDGPRGPRHSFAPGALILAHRAKVPIVTITAHVDRVWRLRSWDGFEIPKPFARISVLYGEPRSLSEGEVRDAANRSDEFAGHMQADLERAAALASTLANAHANAPTR
ncbi:MAG: lysophospholipid acyltransferase family protein [Gemmatimonadaceae bacterium]|nr:lysophospholipid acyltransferase family protein [Gemmatimonadaceae bacterium]